MTIKPISWTQLFFCIIEIELWYLPITLPPMLKADLDAWVVTEIVNESCAINESSGYLILLSLHNVSTSLPLWTNAVSSKYKSSCVFSEPSSNWLSRISFSSFHPPFQHHLYHYYFPLYQHHSLNNACITSSKTLPSHCKWVDQV